MFLTELKLNQSHVHAIEVVAPEEKSHGFPRIQEVNLLRETPYISNLQGQIAWTRSTKEQKKTTAGGLTGMEESSPESNA
jgi:hypothetical protein